MANDNKRAAREVARWLRVGTLTLTTLAPAIDVLMTRLRERNSTMSHEASKAVRSADWQERLLVVGGALSELLAELRHNPYAQDLRKRGEEVADELIERGSKLSQSVVERGSEWSHDLAERSEQATRALSQRSRQVRQELTEHSNPLVLVTGFSVGLAAAVIAVYLLLRKRLTRVDLDEDAHIELPANGYVNGNVIEAGFKRRAPSALAREKAARASEDASVDHSADQQVPFDALLVGVVDTRRYYPIETPLDQLNVAGDKPSDIVYFASEEEAKSQGFVSAD
jgi:hypothetical protein